MSVSIEGGRGLTPLLQKTGKSVAQSPRGSQERGVTLTVNFPRPLPSPAGRLEGTETARDCRTVELWGRPGQAVGTAGGGRPRESDSYYCRLVRFAYPVPASGSSSAPTGSRHNPDPALTYLPAPRSAPQGRHRNLINVTSVPAPPTVAEGLRLP